MGWTISKDGDKDSTWPNAPNVVGYEVVPYVAIGDTLDTQDVGLAPRDRIDGTARWSEAPIKA